MHKTYLKILVLTLLVSGCAVVPLAPSRPTAGNVDRLRTRPEYAAVIKAGPAWVADAENTISDQEMQIKLLKAKLGY